MTPWQWEHPAEPVVLAPLVVRPMPVAGDSEKWLARPQ